MKRLRHLPMLVAALLTAGSALCAADFGFQITASKPGGDLGKAGYQDGKIGLGAGFQMLFDLGGGHALVPRVDYTQYKNDRTQSSITLKRKTRVTSLGMDYEHYFSGTTNVGGYTLLGLGFQSAQIDLEDATSAYHQNISVKHGAAFIAAGVGYRFVQTVGVELRYIGMSEYKADPTVTGPSLNASVVFRF